MMQWMKKGSQGSGKGDALMVGTRSEREEAKVKAAIGFVLTTNLNGSRAVGLAVSSLAFQLRADPAL